jgi:hypothetical protein
MCRTFLLCAGARVNLIDVNTTRKTVKMDDRIAIGDPWPVVF